MKTLDVPPINPKIESDIVQMLGSGANFEQVIAKMRASGLNKVECMKLLRNHAGISLPQAKQVVHLSQAWADRKKSDDALHESIFNALKQLDIA